jgi:hypothetical protein
MSQKLPNHINAMHKKHDVLQITKNESSSALPAPIHSAGVLRSNTKKRMEMLFPRLHRMAPNTIPIPKNIIDTYMDEQFKAVIKKLPKQWQETKLKRHHSHKTPTTNGGLGRI